MSTHRQSLCLVVRSSKFAKKHTEGRFVGAWVSSTIFRLKADCLSQTCLSSAPVGSSFKPHPYAAFRIVLSANTTLSQPLGMLSFRLATAWAVPKSGASPDDLGEELLRLLYRGSIPHQ